MKNIDHHSITPEVIARFTACDNPRLKFLLTELVQSLHDYARKVELTEAELMTAIEFLTAAGQKCDDKRQEFILLSDVLGLSMLTVAQNNKFPPAATEATVFGPFYVDGAPSFQNGDHISNGAHGKPLYVTATVLDLNDQPIANALVHTWQSDSDGFYDVQRPNQEMQGRGNFRTDLQGRIFFQSILPVAYPVPTDGPVGDVLRASGRHPWRPAHVHFMIEAPGYRTLVTHIFRSDDEYLESDVVFGVRSSLIADMPQHAAGQRPPFGETSSEAFHTLDITFRLVKL